VRPGGTEAFDEVSNAFGREFAWQSRHEVGCGRAARVNEAWKRIPPSSEPVAQLAVTRAPGAWWQVLQSAVTNAVVVGAPELQATASWRISPEGGSRTGWVANGPTKPVGRLVALEVW